MLDWLLDILREHFPIIVAVSGGLLFLILIARKIERPKKKKPSKRDIQNELYKDIYGLDEKD